MKGKEQIFEMPTGGAAIMKVLRASLNKPPFDAFKKEVREKTAKSIFKELKKRKFGGSTGGWLR